MANKKELEALIIAEKDRDDIWAKVPKDSDGQYLEAPTDNYGYVTASPEISSVTSYRVKEGHEVGINETVLIGPNGSIVWYLNGPPGTQVLITLFRVPFSGGHDHGGETSDSLAVGSIAPSSFVLPAPYPQNIQCLYRARDVCGAVRMENQFSAGSPSVINNRIGVLIRGLEPIPSSVNLRLKPPKLAHPSPYWGTPSFNSKLVNLANGYAAKTSKAITITDASLEWGGRFDLRSNWSPPHHEHMNGTEADIRNFDMDEKDKQAFLEAAAAARLSVLEESDHWHVRG